MFRRRFESSFLATAMILGVANLYVTTQWISQHEQHEYDHDQRSSAAFLDAPHAPSTAVINIHKVASSNSASIAGARQRQRQGASVSATTKMMLQEGDVNVPVRADESSLVTPEKSKSRADSSISTTYNFGYSYNTTMLSCMEKMPKGTKRKIDCRFDDIGDFLENNENGPYVNINQNMDQNHNTIHNGKGIIHEPLKCIPPHRRIPHEKADDWPYILEQRAKLPDDGSMTALMDYNAMIIPLYKNVKINTKLKSGNNDGHGHSHSTSIKPDLDPKLLDRITGRYHPHFSDSDADQVQYLSISRSSNLHACKPRFKFRFGTTPQDFIGISLLDKNLQRIQGTDVAVNVDQWLLGNGTATFFDFQVVAVKSTEGNLEKDQLILFASGHIGTFSIPMDIRRVPPMEVVKEEYAELDIPWDSKVKGQKVPITSSSRYQYGDGIEVRFMDNPGSFDNLKPYQRPDKFFNTRGVDRGKNFHFFESRSGNTYMEAWPHGSSVDDSHVSVSINFFASEYKPSADLNLFPGKRFQNVKGKRPRVDFLKVRTSKNGDPNLSFQNSAPPHERRNMKYRGTSQIIDMVLNGTDVKVGISHSVSNGKEAHTDRRAYLSQFYAFSPDPPFEIVALTGYFCFNHMTEDDVGYSKQWISERPKDNRTAPILLRKHRYRCPIISFASGMTEMIGHDGSNVIITYGVDDCYSRSIIVPKRKIEMLLLGQHDDGSMNKVSDIMR